MRSLCVLLAIALASVLPAATPPKFEVTSDTPPPFPPSAAVYDIYDNHWELQPAGTGGTTRLMVRPAQSPGAWVPETLSGIQPGPWRFLESDEFGYLWIASSRQLLRLDPRSPARGWSDASALLGADEITALAIAPSGAVLAALKAGRVAEVDLGDAASSRPVVTFSPAPAGVSVLFTDDLGRIWASAAGKTYRQEAQDEVWQRRWGLAGRLPGGNHDLSGAVLRGKFYMAGGQTATWGYPAGDHVFDQIFEFDPVRSQWRIAGRLLHARFYNSIATLDDRLWIIAGNMKDGSGKARDLATVEIFDPGTAKVSAGPELPVAMEMPAAANIGGRIYVAGAPLGATRDSPVKLYSIAAGETKWRTEPDGPAGWKALAGAALGGAFYVVVPQVGLAVFDTRPGKWKTIESPEHPRSCQVAVHRDELWIMGGRDVPAGDHTWIYTPRTGQWRRGPNLPRELAWGAAAEVQGRLLLAGGAAGRSYNNRTFLLREATPLPFFLSGNASPDSARKQIRGQSFAVVADAVPTGPLTIELSFLETEANGPDQRTMAIFANGTLLTPQLDIWKEAGGRDRPVTRKFDFRHDGGRLAISLSGIGRDAVLSAIRVTTPDGTELASGTAAMPRLRETVRDARTRPFRPVHPGEVPFFNVDHSPVGAYATFIYGMKDSGGVQVSPGRRANAGDLIPHDGVLFAAKSGGAIRVMPFAAQTGGLQAGATFVRDTEVKHTLGAATDHWEMPSGVKWTHYSPYWPLRQIDSATNEERKRFSLPATWMVYDLDNRGGKSELQFLFSLKQRNTTRQSWGSLQGYSVDGTTALAVPASDSALITAEAALRDFGVADAHSAFLFRVPAGHRKSVTLIVAHYLGEDVSQVDGESLRYAYTEFFEDLGAVVRAAAAARDASVAESLRLDRQMASSQISAEREFLAAHALHSYQFNTIFRRTVKTGRPLWVVTEGEYGYANTFDLTIDHVFLELALHPWTVRNELDLFRQHFSYVDQVRYPGAQQLWPGGIGFAHDMGSGTTLNAINGQNYNGSMTQEELQNWILCAGLYWRATSDHAWLAAQRDTLIKCLRSMQVRDDVDPAKRDGITSMVSVTGRRDHDITTYDAMDASLQQVHDSLYIAVKSFAAYLALEAMFREEGSAGLAEEARSAAAKTAGSIVSHWDTRKRIFPALFDGKSESRILPAIEGLIYPYMMGLRREVALDGPYGELIRDLKAHMQTVLVPGVCIDPKTGGWWLSSTSQTTWQSKVYLAQFIAEEILGISDARTRGAPDVAHVSYQVLGAPAVGWSYQIRHSDGTAYGGRHYPRGVTSSLWWLPLAR